MLGMIRNIFVLFLLGFFTVASAQLPPEIMADKYLIQTDQLLDKKDYTGAFKVMVQIIALQKEHNFTLSDEFHFKYARVALSADSIKIALDSVNKYLSTTGKEGEFYKEALALLIKIEEDLAKLAELEFTPEKMCTGKPVGSSCWMALANHPECYVWNPNLQKDETATWTGKCSGNVAQGEGTLTFAVTDGDSLKTLETGTGYFQKGHFHDQWVWRSPYGVVNEGPYMYGKRHGQWVTRYRDGGSQIGPYVDGKRHGHWVYR